MLTVKQYSFIVTILSILSYWNKEKGSIKTQP